MEQVKYRAEYLKYQEAQRRKEEEELERERVAYAQIDWHDFVVVETVDYQQFEVGNFPAPTTPDEVGARVLMQVRSQHKFTFKTLILLMSKVKFWIRRVLLNYTARVFIL